MLARVTIKNQFFATNTHHRSIFLLLLRPCYSQLKQNNLKKGPKQKDNSNSTFHSVQQSSYPEIGLVFTLGRITNSVGVFSVECGLAAVFVTLLTVT